MNETISNSMTAMYVQSSLENMNSVKTEQPENVIIARPTSSSYNTPAPIIHIHANAADESFPGVDSTKSGFMPILTEAMREIIDDHQLAANNDDNGEPTQNVHQQEEQQQYPSYVTVGVIPCDEEVKNECDRTADDQKEELPPFTDNFHPQSGNQNQNNCYQGIEGPRDVTSCSTSAYQIAASQIHYSMSKPDDSLETTGQSILQEPCPALSASSPKPVSPKGPVGNGLTIEAPVLNGFQKPKLNIVQQILEAFKASHKKEMHPSEVYEEIQKLYPYYRQLNQKKKKSWMSSVRHALTSSRFKGRKMRDDNTKSIIRKGSLWSLNEKFSNDYSGSRKKSHSSRRGSSRRKQKLSGNTRQDFEDARSFSNNVPQRIAPLPSFPSAHSQISHMQSTFAPGTVVFPSYPMMGYVQQQPQPVYQQPMPPQPWLAVQHQAGGGPSPSKHSRMATEQMKQMPNIIPNSSTRGGHINVQGTPMQMHGQGQDIRTLVYQTMNIPTNNNNNNQSLQQNINQNQSAVGPSMVLQHAYQTPAVSYPSNPGPSQMISPNVQKIQQAIVPKRQTAPVAACPQPAVNHPVEKPSGNFDHSILSEGSNAHQVAPPTSLHWAYAQPRQMAATQHNQFNTGGQMSMESQNVSTSHAASNFAIPSSVYATLGQSIPVPPVDSMTTSSCNGNKMVSYSFAPYGEVQPVGSTQYTNHLQPVHLTSST